MRTQENFITKFNCRSAPNYGHTGTICDPVDPFKNHVPVLLHAKSACNAPDGYLGHITTPQVCATVAGSRGCTAFMFSASAIQCRCCQKPQNKYAASSWDASARARVAMVGLIEMVAPLKPPRTSPRPLDRSTLSPPILLSQMPFLLAWVASTRWRSTPHWIVFFLCTRITPSA